MYYMFIYTYVICINMGVYACINIYLYAYVQMYAYIYTCIYTYKDESSLKIRRMLL